MKHFVCLLILLCAGHAFATVDVVDGKVTANIQAEQLRDVLKQIADKTGIRTEIDNSAANDLVYANFKDLSVGAAIRKLLEGTDINYAVIGDSDSRPTAIFVSRSENTGGPAKRLDTRPVSVQPSRGIVTPVTPPQFQQPSSIRDPNAQGQMKPQPPDQKPQAAQPAGNNEVPTAGSFGSAPQTPNQQQLGRPDIKPDASADDSSDDDDDSDE